MREIAALMRASALTALSYRLQMVLSLGGVLVTVVPVYFAARALQPLMAPSIAGQGGEYFGFVLVGMAAFQLLVPALMALPGAVGAGIRSGTLEAMLATPARLPALLAGLVAYDLAWAAARAAILLAAGVALGATLAWGQALAALAILLLVVVAHLPVGVLGAALVLAFRTTGPLPKMVLTASVLLGGVYYPTQVVPAGLDRLADAVPLAYGLRALRRTLLDGAPVAEVMGDVAVLAAFAAVLLAGSALVFNAALAHARRTGTLAQY
jgi:ABC-2 type transport system permease protein